MSPTRQLGGESQAWRVSWPIKHRDGRFQGAIGHCRQTVIVSRDGRRTSLLQRGPVGGADGRVNALLTKNFIIVTMTLLAVI